MERNRTTTINLVNYSWDRDEEGDSPSEKTLLEYDDDTQDHSSSSNPSSSRNQDGPPNNNDQHQRDSDNDGSYSRSFSHYQDLKGSSWIKWRSDWTACKFYSSMKCNTQSKAKRKFAGWEADNFISKCFDTPMSLSLIILIARITHA